MVRRQRAELVRGRAGDALAQADTSPGLYISMVRAGEAGGALETVLDRLADYLESQVRLKNKVSSILIYPLVMLGFAAFVLRLWRLGRELNQPEGSEEVEPKR